MSNLAFVEFREGCQRKPTANPVSGSGWKKIVDQYQAWDWCRKQKDEPLLVKMAERSFMTWPEQRVIAKLCERGCWELTCPGLEEFLQNLWDRGLSEYCLECPLSIGSSTQRHRI